MADLEGIIALINVTKSIKGTPPPEFPFICFKVQSPYTEEHCSPGALLPNKALMINKK